MLIAGELQITVPQVSFNDIDNFIRETAELHHASKMSLEEKAYMQRTHREYPWDRRLLEYEGKTFHNYKEHTAFIQLVNIIESLPINSLSRVVLLLSQKAQTDYDFNWHFDRDNQIGFRICIGLDTTKPFLEFARLKEEYKNYNKNMKRIEPYMVEEQIYDITPTKTNTVLCVNGERYPHRVPLNNNTERCAIIVRGDLMHTNFNFCQRIDDEFHI